MAIRTQEMIEEAALQRNLKLMAARIQKRGPKAASVMTWGDGSDSARAEARKLLATIQAVKLEQAIERRAEQRERERANQFERDCKDERRAIQALERAEEIVELRLSGVTWQEAARVVGLGNPSSAYQAAARFGDPKALQKGHFSW